MEISSRLTVQLKKITNQIPISTYQTIFQRDVLSFVYHVVSNASLPHIKHLYAYKSPRMFENDLLYLLRDHHFASYEQLVDHQFNRISLKSNLIFLSFDDGLRECFTEARPLLLKYGIPCTFFVTTDLIDNQKMFFRQKISLCIDKVVTSEELWRRSIFDKLSDLSGCLIQTLQDFIKWSKSLKYADQGLIDQVCVILDVDIQGYLQSKKPFMSKDDLKILSSDGFTIGAHSKSHPLLGQLPAEVIEQEIVESCQIIQGITGAESIPFAFPFHGKGLRKGFLKDIRQRNKTVGYYFGSGGIKEHQGLIHDRILADVHEEDGGERSNLPELLHLAYQEQSLRWLGKYKSLLLQIARPARREEISAISKQ